MEMFCHCKVKELLMVEIIFYCAFIISCFDFSVGIIAVCHEEGLMESVLYGGKKSFRTMKAILLYE
jgi:hypothetical protein